MPDLLAAATTAPDPDASAEFHRQAMVVHGLARLLEEAVERLDATRVADDWWGPARQALQGAIDLERERLRREMQRLDGVVDQLRVDAAVATGVLAPFPHGAGVLP